MRFSRLKLPLVLLVLAVPVGHIRAEAISEERLERLFRPRLGERMALSTDGHYLAYTQHEKTDLVIVVFDLEKLRPLTRIVADDDRPIMFSKERQRTELRFLDWANGHRLVFAPAIKRVPPPVQPPSANALAGMPPEMRAIMRSMAAPSSVRVIAPVKAVDADGGHPLDLEHDGLASLIEETIPGGSTRDVVPDLHGFDTGKNRDQLLVEVHSNTPGVPNELYRLNVETGKHRSLNRAFVTGGSLFYDRAGEPRLNPFTPRRSTTTTFQYRAPGAKKWSEMPAPPDEDRGAQFTVSPENYFGPRVTALGFDFDPNVLIYASNVGRDTFGIYGVDLRTRQRTALALEVPHRDLVGLDTAIATPPLVVDAYREKIAGVRANFGPRPLTVWIDPELAAIQRAVERRFPERSVQVEQWNEARTRFIVRTTGGADPGSIFLVRRPEGSMTELTRAAPWLAESELHETQFFEFTAPSGAQLTGHLTLPRTPRLNPPPLLVWLAPGLPPRAHPEFDPQAQVFADIGFVVCRLNQRGVLGLGAEHRDALRRDLDHASAEDAVAAVEWVAQHHPIDRKRVAMYGEGFAGHLALRATQLYPQAFRCAVVIAPVIHLGTLVQSLPDLDATDLPSFQQLVNRRFLEGSGVKLEELSTTAYADAWTAAVFVAAPVDQSADLAAGIADLRAQLGRRDLPCVTIDFNPDFTNGLPAARARVYRALDEFINLYLYNYDVKIGPTRVVK